MRILVLFLVLGCWTFSSATKMDHRQKRQLNWNEKRIYDYDHLAISSDVNQQEINQDHQATGTGSVPGEPGIDYPILPMIPLTDFHCRGRVPGFYGDTQTACQVFHVCDISGRQDSFLCPNGTIFSQKLFACDWWYNVQCANTRHHYQLNRNLFKGSELNLYGTPSFWNWLSEAEETTSTLPPRIVAKKSVESSRKRSYKASRVESSMPSTSPPPTQFREQRQPAEDVLPDGFTKDYADHYYGWIKSNNRQRSLSNPEDMVSELSWADLSPNGPLMTDSPAVGKSLPATDNHPSDVQKPTKSTKSKRLTTTTTMKPVTTKTDDRDQPQNRFKNGKRANAKRSPVTDRLLLPSRDHRQPKSISPPSYSSGFDRREDTNHRALKKSSKLSSFQTKIDKAPPVAIPLPVSQSPNRRISSNPLTMEKMAPVFRPSQLILPPVESKRRVTSLPPIGTAKRSYHYNHKIHKSQNWESIKI